MTSVSRDPDVELIKGVRFIDKTRINRANVRVQTVGKGSLLENRRMAEVRPGQILALEQRDRAAPVNENTEIRQQLEQPGLDTLSCRETSPVR